MAGNFDKVSINKQNANEATIRFEFKGFEPTDNAGAEVANKKLTVTATHGNDKRIATFHGWNIGENPKVQGFHGYIHVTVKKMTDVALNL